MLLEIEIGDSIAKLRVFSAKITLLNPFPIYTVLFFCEHLHVM